jgi:hypothetical protein
MMEAMMHPFVLFAGIAALAAPNVDRNTVARLDRTYQEAVKRNDVETMKRILHPGFQLVLGDGRRPSSSRCHRLTHFADL